MVILRRERFGIAQLQPSCATAWGGGAGPQLVLLTRQGLRWRGLRSGCPPLETNERGFELAEVDLACVRGHDPGARQKGRSDLLLASLTRDRGTPR